MFHDQALIPFKYISQFSGVNYTGNLNIIRTSPDHGTANKLVGSKNISSKSFINCFKLINKIYKIELLMIKAKKSLSQNFIIDQNICKKIINQTKVKNRLILEIGPGYGFMTDHILKGKPKKIILIEKDIELTKFLNKKYKDNKIIKIINKDFLKYDLKKHKIYSNFKFTL